MCYPAQFDPADVTVRPLDVSARDATAEPPRRWWSRPSSPPIIWAVEAGDERLATLELQPDSAEILRLRRFRLLQHVTVSVIGPPLLRQLVKHCHERGYLKVVIESPCDLEQAQQLMHEHGLEFTGQRRDEEGSIVEYYVDLYRPDGNDDE